MSVKIRVFRLQIVVNVLVALAERISIRAVSSWARHLYLTIRTERANFKALFTKDDYRINKNKTINVLLFTIKRDGLPYYGSYY